MAANFGRVKTWRTTELEGGSSVVPVQEFSTTSNPSGLYFQFRRPESQLAKLSATDRAALVASIADQIAVRMEAALKLHGVTWLAYSQPTNPAGQLLDIITLYVESDSGDSEGQVDVPIANIGPGEYTASRVAAEVEALNDIEGL